MSNRSTVSTLEHLCEPVKPDINSQLPLFSDTMIHHNVSPSPRKKIIVSYNTLSSRRYGVSSSRRVLSPQLLLKKFDLVRDCLESVLGITAAQSEVTLRLLRLWAYYGQVYPKEAQITEDPGCKKATFWRTIKLLENIGLLKRINRFVIRPHAQISNLYRLDGLIIVIAKYLAEHIAHVWPDWILPRLRIPWPELWNVLRGDQLKLPLLSADFHTAPW